MRRGLIALLLAAVVALAVTACGGSSKTSTTSQGSKGSAGSVTISNEQGTTWTCNFNPFNASVQFLSFGPVYEDLVYQNLLQSGKATPWLASSYAWSNKNQTLTFTIRKGVKWQDGKPLTANDVVYTFQLIKKNPGLDLNASWSVLKSVTLKGSDQVVFDFKTPAVPYFFYVAGQTPIVAQHIWSKISNPVTYKDTKPVGTGPYGMSSCSPQEIKYAKNPSYWQPGLPKIQKIVLPGLHVEQAGERRPCQRQGAVGRPVHPQHRQVLPLEEPREPLLVPAGPERRDVPEPHEPDPQGRRRSAGDLVRDRPPAGVADRGVRLPAGREPDRHRHADVLELARSPVCDKATTTTRTRRSRSSPTPATS